MKYVFNVFDGGEIVYQDELIVTRLSNILSLPDEVESCIRTSSNFIMATAHSLYKLTHKPEPFDLSEMGEIY